MKNTGSQLHAIKVEGCDAPKARVSVFVARPMGLSPVPQKNAPFCSTPRSRDFRFNRRLTGRGVQRTRTLYFDDLSIGICLDYDASFGFDIDVGSLGIFESY